MICNEKQYKVTKKWADRFLDAYREHPKPTSKIEQASKDSLRGQYDDLNQEIMEYESLKSGKITCFEGGKLSDIPKILIKARIAQGLTQAQLAAKLNMAPQQIQRYEAEEYYGANFTRLEKIADCLNLRILELLFDILETPDE